MSVTTDSAALGPVSLTHTGLAQYRDYTRVVQLGAPILLTSQVQLTLVAGDTLPIFQFQILAADNSVVDLTNAATVNFYLYDLQGNLLFNNPASIGPVSGAVPSQGIVYYAWQAGDTSVAGLYAGRFQITFNDGTQLTAPQDQPIRFNIEPPGFSI